MAAFELTILCPEDLDLEHSFLSSQTYRQTCQSLTLHVQKHSGTRSHPPQHENMSNGHLQLISPIAETLYLPDILPFQGMLAMAHKHAQSCTHFRQSSGISTSGPCKGCQEPSKGCRLIQARLDDLNSRTAQAKHAGDKSQQSPSFHQSANLPPFSQLQSPCRNHRIFKQRWPLLRQAISSNVLAKVPKHLGASLGSQRLHPCKAKGCNFSSWHSLEPQRQYP